MKKLLVNMLCLLPLAGFAQKPFTVNGKVGNMNKPMIATLSYMEGSAMREDSCMLVNGVFTFKGNVAEPSIGRLYVKQQGTTGKQFVTFLLDGVVKVTAKDSLKNAVIKGSQLNADYLDVNRRKNVTSDKLAKLWNDYQAQDPKTRDAKAFGTIYEKTMKEDLATKEKIDMDFAFSHPNSLLSPMLLVFRANSMQIDTLEMFYQSLTPAVKESTSAKVIAQKIYDRRSIEVNGIAPDFTIPDTKGTPVSLSSYRGKYVLVDFWASWCKPCRAENPNVLKAFNTYKDKNFTVLSVSIDDSSAKDKWLKAIEDDRIGVWTHVCELMGRASQIGNLYDLKTIPQNVLVGPDGKILAKNLRGEDLQAKLSEILH